MMNDKVGGLKYRAVKHGKWPVQYYDGFGQKRIKVIFYFNGEERYSSYPVLFIDHIDKIAIRLYPPYVDINPPSPKATIRLTLDQCRVLFGTIKPSKVYGRLIQYTRHGDLSLLPEIANELLYLKGSISSKETSYLDSYTTLPPHIQKIALNALKRITGGEEWSVQAVKPALTGQ